MGADSPLTLARPESAAWLVPLAVILAELVGALVAGEVRLSVNPSGTVQNTMTTPLNEQMDEFNVVILFGAPYAALAAAAISYFGLRSARPWIFGCVGIIAGVVVFSIVGFEGLAIGQWWVSSVPADTNHAAALFTPLLVPPGALAAQLAVSTTRSSPAVRPRAVAARFISVGAMLGLLLGSLLATIAAALTWAINCPQNGYSSCFTVSSVVSSALLIGSLIGLGIGAVTGTISWLARLRPASE